MPIVSVVIPTYNYARYIHQAIDSVLAQTFTDYEIIVIDDGSTDDTADVIRRYGDRVRYEFQENMGLPMTRNRGCAIARGEYFAFLDADDVWLPEKLAVQVHALERHPEAGMVCGSMYRIDVEGRPLPGPKPSIPPGETPIEMLERGTALPSTWIVRRSCFEAIGGFDAHLTAMEDYEFALRAAAHSPVICLPEVLVNYRMHTGSMSSHSEWMARGYIQVFDKLLGEWKDPILRRIMRRSRAQYRYRLGKIRFREDDTDSARRLIARAIVEAPGFAWPRGTPMRPWSRFLRMSRPYALLLGVCIAPDAARSRMKADAPAPGRLSPERNPKGAA